MTAPTHLSGAAPILVVSDPLAGLEVEGLSVLPLTAWRESLVPLGDGTFAISDATVLGLLLAGPDHGRLMSEQGLADLLAAAQIPVRDLGYDPDAQTALAVASTLLAARCDALAGQAAADRAALAELRMAHMETQQDHADLERWVWDALTPKHKLVRSWPAADQTVTLDPDTETLIQPLPIPARGFIALDLHLAQAPSGPVRLRLQLRRPVGPAFGGTETDVTLMPDRHGWTRLTLPRAPGGAPEDAVLAIGHIDGPPLTLSLAPPTPFADLVCHRADTRLEAPLALRIYQTLPRMPAPPIHDLRTPVPADGAARLVSPAAFDEPVLLPHWRSRLRRLLRPYPDAVSTEYWDQAEAQVLRPSAARPVVARLPGLTAEHMTQLAATVQSASRHSLPIAVAIGAAPAGTIDCVEDALGHIGDWVHLLPGEWAEAWVEPARPIDGPVDLLLAAAMPGQPFNEFAEALFHAYRVTGRAPLAETRSEPAEAPAAAAR